MLNYDTDSFSCLLPVEGVAHSLTQEPPKTDPNRNRIIGGSRLMKKVRQLVREFAMEYDPILLNGETGVGKNHIAWVIHHYSARRGKFVVADMTTISENLFESEMFGHRRGAFTDAWTDKEGLVEKADGGTLFIDEISEVPIGIQAKLMRFIDTQRYRIVGTTTERKANVRIIAASNKDLREAISKGEFRQDLYFRLQAFEILIPPLRHRREDVMELVNSHLHLLKGKSPGSGFWECLQKYDWPGNVRELQNIIKRAGISCNDPITGPELQSIIKQGCFLLPEYSKTNHKKHIDDIWYQLISSESDFWTAVKKPFLARDLNRTEVKEIIHRGLTLANGKYKDLIKIFNLNDKDYHKFMTFLRDNKLR
jgi:DNA-binding NtrC family response regulator